MPTDVSAETGISQLTNTIGGTAEAGLPDEVAPRPENYVFLKRRFYRACVAEVLRE